MARNIFRQLWPTPPSLSDSVVSVEPEAPPIPPGESQQQTQGIAPTPPTTPVPETIKSGYHIFKALDPSFTEDEIGKIPQTSLIKFFRELISEQREQIDNLRKYEGLYHERDKDAAIWQSRANVHSILDIVESICLGIGGVLLGLGFTIQNNVIATNGLGILGGILMAMGVCLRIILYLNKV